LLFDRLVREETDRRPWLYRIVQWCWSRTYILCSVRGSTGDMGNKSPLG